MNRWICDFLPIVSATSTPPTSLPSCPRCDYLAYVLVQHPRQPSLRRQGLASWCKVDQSGGRGDCERAQARHSSYCPFRTRGGKTLGRQEEEAEEESVLWQQHTLLWHKQFWKPSLHIFYFLFLLSHETNLFSLWKKQNTLSKFTLRRKPIQIIKPGTDVHGE